MHIFRSQESPCLVEFIHTEPLLAFQRKGGHWLVAGESIACQRVLALRMWRGTRRQ